jgi:hypothetical protein
MGQSLETIPQAKPGAQVNQSKSNISVDFINHVLLGQGLNLNETHWSYSEPLELQLTGYTLE